MNFKHGLWAYGKHGCRCEICRAANRERQRKRLRTDKGRAKNRLNASIQAKLNGLLLQWVKENHPEILPELRKQAKQIVMEKRRLMADTEQANGDGRLQTDR